VVVFSNALASDDRRHRVQSLGVTRILAKASTPPRLLSLLLNELLGMVEETRRLATDPEPVADLDGVARTALVHLGALLADLGRGNPVASQTSLLRGIAETARGVSSSAAASGRSALAAMAEGAEHLARRLADEDEAITSSLHRTLAQAVDRMRGLVSDLTPAAPAPWRPGQTLVVDDDRLAAHYATKALEKVHVPVTTVHDPQAALRLLDEHAFSLLVSDVCMAGMAGDELAKRVRAHPRYATVPIIFVTACADFTFRLPDGTDSDVIAKPYQMAELAVKALTHLTSLG
jgi:two-component system chemotaxis response regulator CheY